MSLGKLQLLPVNSEFLTTSIAWRSWVRSANAFSRTMSWLLLRTTAITSFPKQDLLLYYQGFGSRVVVSIVFCLQKVDKDDFLYPI